MILRLFVYASSPLQSVVLAFSLVLGNDLWQGIPFVLASAYIYTRMLRAMLRGQLLRLRRVDGGIALVYAYVISSSPL